MPGNFAPEALIMLNCGANVLQFVKEVCYDPSCGLGANALKFAQCYHGPSNNGLL